MRSHQPYIFGSGRVSFAVLQFDSAVLFACSYERGLNPLDGLSVATPHLLQPDHFDFAHGHEFQSIAASSLLLVRNDAFYLSVR